MKSPESTMADVLAAIKGNHLSLDQLKEIQRMLHYGIQDARTKEESRLANADPQDLMPGNWGMYGVYEADFADDADFVKATEVFENAKVALDKVGCKLVRAIRRNDLNQTRNVVAEVRNLQSKYRELGANDTEGRHALQNVMERACNGSPFDFEGLWDRV